MRFSHATALCLKLVNQVCILTLNSLSNYHIKSNTHLILKMLILFSMVRHVHGMKHLHWNLLCVCVYVSRRLTLCKRTINFKKSLDSSIQYIKCQLSLKCGNPYDILSLAHQILIRHLAETSHTVTNMFFTLLPEQNALK